MFPRAEGFVSFVVFNRVLDLGNRSVESMSIDVFADCVNSGGNFLKFLEMAMRLLEVAGFNQQTDEFFQNSRESSRRALDSECFISENDISSNHCVCGWLKLTACNIIGYSGKEFDGMR